MHAPAQLQTGASGASSCSAALSRPVRDQARERSGSPERAWRPDGLLRMGVFGCKIQFRALRTLTTPQPRPRSSSSAPRRRPSAPRGSTARHSWPLAVSTAEPAAKHSTPVVKDAEPMCTYSPVAKPGGLVRTSTLQALAHDMRTSDSPINKRQALRRTLKSR